MLRHIKNVIHDPSGTHSAREETDQYLQQDEHRGSYNFHPNHALFMANGSIMNNSTWTKSIWQVGPPKPKLSINLGQDGMRSLQVPRKLRPWRDQLSGQWMWKSWYCFLEFIRQKREDESQYVEWLRNIRGIGWFVSVSASSIMWMEQRINEGKWQDVVIRYPAKKLLWLQWEVANNTKFSKKQGEASCLWNKAFRWPTTLPTTISVFWNGSLYSLPCGIGENIIRLMHLYPMAFCRDSGRPQGLVLSFLPRSRAFAWGSWVPHHTHIFTQVRWHAQSHLTSLLHSSEGITASLGSWEWNMPAVRRGPVREPEREVY